MRSLLLSGYKIHIGVDDGKLVIKDGRDLGKDPAEWVYKPRNIDLDQIVLYGHTGDLTISAMKWLMKHSIPIHVLDYNGTLITSMNPPSSKLGAVKLAQYKAHTERRIPMARFFIDAKLRRSRELLDWVLDRYPEIQHEYDLCNFDQALKDLKKASTIRDIMGIEGIIARFYWDAMEKVIPDKFGFEKRAFKITHRPLGAEDQVNALFNYGYAVLEGICRGAVISANLDPYIGFLHEEKATKEPLVYDLQEPFRWLVDFTIINAMERNLFLKKDFIRTDDYIIRIRPDAVKKLMTELDRQFSQTVKCGSRQEQWGNIIGIKAQELSNYLTDKRKTMDLSAPLSCIDRVDNADMRKKILGLSYYKWHKMGYSKGTLHYMKKNARADKPFTLNQHVKRRLNTL